MKRDFYKKQDAGRSIYYVLIAFLLAQILFMFFPTNLGETAQFFITLLQSLIMEGAFLFIFIFFNKKNNVDGIKIIGVKKKTGVLTYVLCIAISFLVLLLTYHFFNYVDALFIKIGFNKSENPFKLDGFYKLILTTLVLAIWPAICEETVYRGIIYNGLAQKNKISAVFISAVMFALMHMGVFQLAYQFYLGVIFAFVFMFTKDIKLSMTMHFANNFLVLLLTYLKDSFNFNWYFWQPINFWLTLFMFLVCTALIGGILYIIKKENEKKLQSHTVEKITAIENKSANISIILTIGVYVFIQIVTLALMLSGTGV